MNVQRVQLTPGYVLHQRPFRDTSLIVELFTRDHGRLSCFARAARGTQTRFVGLQPFAPLLLSWSGRGESPQLCAAEPDGYTPPLPGKQLLNAFYLNELLLKLMFTHDSHPEIYAAYGEALQLLRTAANAEQALRRFELQLLEHLGYGMDLLSEAGSGAAVRAEASYEFVPGVGLLSSDGPFAVPGRLLQDLAAGAALTDTDDQRLARGFMRRALDQCLEGRELRTRAVARAMAQAARSGRAA